MGCYFGTEDPAAQALVMAWSPCLSPVGSIQPGQHQPCPTVPPFPREPGATPCGPQNSHPWGRKAEGKLLNPISAAATGPAQPGVPQRMLLWHCFSHALEPQHQRGSHVEEHPMAQGALVHGTAGSHPTEPPQQQPPLGTASPGHHWGIPELAAPGPPLLLLPLPLPWHAGTCPSGWALALAKSLLPRSISSSSSPSRASGNWPPPAPASPQAPHTKQEPCQG